MKKNILKSMLHFDMDRYQKLVDAKNGITRIEPKKKTMCQLKIIKISVFIFIMLLVTISILTICFIGE
jgi:hypothetical protein